jgi:hypothetical protein
MLWMCIRWDEARDLIDAGAMKRECFHFTHHSSNVLLKSSENTNCSTGPASVRAIHNMNRIVQRTWDDDTYVRVCNSPFAIRTIDVRTILARIRVIVHK